MPRPSRPWYRADRKTWYTTIDGQRVRLATGARDATRAEAMHRFHEIMARRDGGPPVTSERIALGALIIRYLAHCDGRVQRGELKAKTRDWYENLLAPFVAALGRRVAASITPADVLSVLDAHPSWRATARAAHAGILRTVLRWGVAMRLLDTDPTTGMAMPVRARRRVDVIRDAATAQVILSAIRTPAFRDYMTFLYETGCRPGEAADLTADQIDLEAGIAELRDHKNARRGLDRTIVLTPVALALVRRLMAERPAGRLFLTSRGRRWTPQACHCQMRRLRDRLGLGPEAIPYAMRHLFITDALQGGVGAATVAALTGTSIGQISRTYSRLEARRPHLRDAVAAVRPTPSPTPSTMSTPEPAAARPDEPGTLPDTAPAPPE